MFLSRLNDLPLTALLANTTLEELGDLTPVLGLELVNLFDKNAIFFFSPRAFFHIRIQDFLPAVEALDISAVFETLSNFFPVARLNN